MSSPYFEGFDLPELLPLAQPSAAAYWSPRPKTAILVAGAFLEPHEGHPMTTGTDYSVNADGDGFRSYVQAVADVMHNDSMGSCYWSGLRNGDSYSMTTLGTGGSPLTLTVTNPSGLDRVHWAWRL
jgi:hypothetical protein